MEQPSWSSGVDTGTPSPARVYDFFLGGSHNFDVDRRMARQLERAMPDIGKIMRANRSFLRRAVSYLMKSGVRQLLDLGSGIPTVGNVHEVARRTAPDTKVVYVDIDPVTVAHARAVLADDPLTAIVEADLRQPSAVLADPAMAMLDLRQPVGVLLAGVLHQITAVDPASMIAEYRQALSSGSYLTLSQATQDRRPQEAEALASAYNRGYAPGPTMTLRSRSEVLRFFDGFELVEPGLVQVVEWRPDESGHADEDPERYATYAGVGRLR